MNGTSKSMSHPKIAAPGEAFNTVWNVEQIAHAALSLTPQEGPQSDMPARIHPVRTKTFGRS
jgi:hypothetical protein